MKNSVLYLYLFEPMLTFTLASLVTKHIPKSAEQEMCSNRQNSCPMKPPIMESYKSGICADGSDDLSIYDMRYGRCVDECRTRPACTAVNVYSKIKLCRLNFQLGLTPRKCPKHVYSEKAHWKQKSKTGCESLTCTTTQKCEKVDNKYTCVTTECPNNQFEIKNGHFSGNQVTFGETRRFWCKRGYSLIGSKIIRCQPDGTWSDEPPICSEITTDQATTTSTRTSIPTTSTQETTTSNSTSTLTTSTQETTTSESTSIPTTSTQETTTSESTSIPTTSTEETTTSKSISVPKTSIQETTTSDSSTSTLTTSTQASTNSESTRIPTTSIQETTTSESTSTLTTSTQAITTSESTRISTTSTQESTTSESTSVSTTTTQDTTSSDSTSMPTTTTQQTPSPVISFDFSITTEEEFVTEVPCFPSQKNKVVEPEQAAPPTKHVYRYGETSITHISQPLKPDQWKKSARDPNYGRRLPQAPPNYRAPLPPRPVTPPSPAQSRPYPVQPRPQKQQPQQPIRADFFVSVPIFTETFDHSYRKKNEYVYTDDKDDETSLYHQSLSRASSLRDLSLKGTHRSVESQPLTQPQPRPLKRRPQSAHRQDHNLSGGSLNRSFERYNVEKHRSYHGHKVNRRRPLSASEASYNTHSSRGSYEDERLEKAVSMKKAPKKRGILIESDDEDER